ncbi:hypothetical protein L2E82_06703 [Cichorium intybus]|uniref:Uncharacterized protein n=1 Tax=Cichorium intybus TaxID=13427 RepID=A0ACB9HB71_CICIN|nr:hypothetical protein L2E82_06703 [Cichorium intybus]
MRDEGSSVEKRGSGGGIIDAGVWRTKEDDAKQIDCKPDLLILVGETESDCGGGGGYPWLKKAVTRVDYGGDYVSVARVPVLSIIDGGVNQTKYHHRHPMICGSAVVGR